MELYVDTGDLAAIQAVADYLPIDGFTTNPKILAKAPRPVEELMGQYRAYVTKNNLKIFFQVTAERAAGMFAQAQALQAYFGPHFIVKIPAVQEGYKALRLCKDAGIPVLFTVVHSLNQALLAAKAGADYVAPYVSHIDAAGTNAEACLADMTAAFLNGGYPCKVLAASIHEADQLGRLAAQGCPAATIAPALFHALIAHPATDAAMASFGESWRAAFGVRHISDLIPGQ